MSALKSIYQRMFQRSINYGAVTLIGAIAIGSIFDIIPNYIFGKYNKGILFEDVLAQRTAGDDEE